jgi:hypothetical protein
MYKAAAVAILGAVADNPYLSTQQIKVVLEHVK